MQTIEKPQRKVHEYAIAEAKRRGFSHYRIARNAIVLGSKAELKRGSYAKIHCVSFVKDDPDSWGATRIPRGDKWVWSDEYYARKQGLALRKEVGHE